MRTKRISALLLGLSLIVFFATTSVRMSGQGGAAPAIDNDDIGGVVTGAQGPEAGVWVIAETRSTPTRLIKSVVTDDRGRYVVPDLPAGEYDVWVRGYGLVDSAKVKSAPGKVVNLKAVAAPDKKAAAQYYPAQYWFALLQMPPKSDFPGTGDKGNGISPNIKSQGEWVRNIVNTDGCTGCHQMGGPATRDDPVEHPQRVRGHEDGVGPPHPVRAGRRWHERALHAGGPRPRARDVRRLDRSHREG